MTWPLFLLLLCDSATAEPTVPCVLPTALTHPRDVTSTRGGHLDKDWVLESALPGWCQRAAVRGRRLTLLPSPEPNMLPGVGPGRRYAVSAPLAGTGGVLGYVLVLERRIAGYRVRVTDLKWTPRTPAAPCPPAARISDEIQQVLGLLKAAYTR